uniref:Uncharacterized protein n=1 Tax=Psorophora albipes TaxID=869069 RepID=T1DJ05_9DIPT
MFCFLVCLLLLRATFYSTLVLFPSDLSGFTKTIVLCSLFALSVPFFISSFLFVFTLDACLFLLFPLPNTFALTFIIFDPSERLSSVCLFAFPCFLPFFHTFFVCFASFFFVLLSRFQFSLSSSAFFILSFLFFFKFTQF